MMINNYVAYYRGSTKKLERDTTNDRNDFDIIRENHRFLWSTNELTEAEQSWEARLAKRYYEKLFKEYCIVDLSQYRKNLCAMRWRTEKEVFSGKGQFECGEKHCQSREKAGDPESALSSWEVNFAYTEHDVRKNALVKVRLCPECSAKLNFHSQKRLIKKTVKKQIKMEEEIIGKRKEEERKLKKKRREKKHRRQSAESSSSSSSSSTEESGDEKMENNEVNEQKLSVEEKNKIDRESKMAAQSASEIWAKKTTVLEAEKSINDEFDDFIDDLLF